MKYYCIRAKKLRSRNTWYYLAIHPKVDSKIEHETKLKLEFPSYEGTMLVFVPKIMLQYRNIFISDRRNCVKGIKDLVTIRELFIRYKVFEGHLISNLTLDNVNYKTIEIFEVKI